MGFESVKWSFFEAGHGKGIPDALGGALKRGADQKVRYGHDIMSAEDFIEQMQNGKSKVMLDTESEIETVKEKLGQNKLKPVPGTMKLHQVIVQPNRIISYSNLSCACNQSCNLCCETIKTSKTVEEPNVESPVKIVKRKFENKDDRNLNAKKTKFNEDTDIKAKNNKRNYGLENESITECLAGTSVNVQRIESNNEPRQDVLRRETFAKHLHELHRCKTYTALKKKCNAIKLDKYTLKPLDVCMLTSAQEGHDKLEPDYDSASYMPDDIQTDIDLCPCTVKIDGNCLPSCGSVFAFGHIHNVDEIRVRIIKELTENEDVYLNDDFLEKGHGLSSSGKKKQNLSFIYAQYSENFIPGTKLDKKKVRTLYRNEIMSITQDQSFMGIWQIHALSTVLNKPIYSVYPNLGNPSVRKDLNRQCNPRSWNNQAHQDTDYAFILWTSNRGDLTEEHWVPNHFVPLLPIILEDNIINANEAQTAHSIDEGVANENDNADFVTIYVYEGNDMGMNDITEENVPETKKTNEIYDNSTFKSPDDTNKVDQRNNDKVKNVEQEKVRTDETVPNETLYYVSPDKIVEPDLNYSIQDIGLEKDFLLNVGLKCTGNIKQNGCESHDITNEMETPDTLKTDETIIHGCTNIPNKTYIDNGNNNKDMGQGKK